MSAYQQIYQQSGVVGNGFLWTDTEGKTDNSRIFIGYFRLCWIVLDVLLVPKGATNYQFNKVYKRPYNPVK